MVAGVYLQVATARILLAQRYNIKYALLQAARSAMPQDMHNWNSQPRVVWLWDSLHRTVNLLPIWLTWTTAGEASNKLIIFQLAVTTLAKGAFKVAICWSLRMQIPAQVVLELSKVCKAEQQQDNVDSIHYAGVVVQQMSSLFENLDLNILKAIDGCLFSQDLLHPLLWGLHCRVWNFKLKTPSYGG